MLGVQNCPSTNSSNLAPILCALDAQLVIGADEAHTKMPLRELWLNEGTRAAFAPRLEPGQVVFAIDLEPQDLATAHVELRQRQSYDWATAICAVGMKLAGDTVKDVRIWLGAVAPVPWQAAAAEKALLGKSVSDANIDAAAKLAAQGAQPLSEGAYKLAMVQHVCAKALKLARERARSN